jgi:glycosyltransferase involved in cell wall biosynthesis
MSEPLFISVLIPVHNEPESIVNAVQSILNQSYPFFELLVCDDGSDIPVSNILNFISDNRLRIIKNNERKGIPFTRNRLLEECSHKLIAWLDADDISMPKRLEKQAAIFSKFPKTLLCFTNAILDFGERKTTTKLVDNPTLNSAILYYRQPFVFSSCMTWKDPINKLGDRFNEKYKRGQDYDYLLQFNFWCKSGIMELRVCEEVLTHHHVKDDSLKPDTEKKFEYLADILDSKLYALLPIEDVLLYIKFIRDIKSCNVKEVEEAIYILFRGIFHNNYWSKKQRSYHYTIYNYYVLKAAYFHSFRFLKELKWPIDMLILLRLAKMKL